MRELNRLFRTYRSTNHKGWAKDIAPFEKVLNQIVHESTGYAPCELHFGHAPDSPIRESISYSASEVVADHHVRLYWAHNNLNRSAQRRVRRSQPDSPTAPVVFEDGSLVVLKANPVASDSLAETKKFLPIFEGPYKVAHRLATKTYELVRPDTG